MTAIVRLSVARGGFKGFEINERESFDLLHFGDDTVLVGEGSWSNLWALKVILRGFEMVSRLRINMWKRYLEGCYVNLVEGYDGIGDDLEESGLVQMLSFKFGDGTKTPFWYGKWIDHESLRLAFLLTADCDGCVASMGERVNRAVATVENIMPDNRLVIKEIWTTGMPSKVNIFAWRLLQDRLPTRTQLLKREIIADNEDCLCVYGYPIKEDINHLFMYCVKLKEVWESIHVWLGLPLVHEADCASFFLKIMVELKTKCSPKRPGAIWAAVCWCIWKQRNDIIFINALEDVDEIVHNVKMYL
ncbi:uncharacterized protein LOC131604915 [Vicia villosa]|uniref:uncharacterized protein LOC131604915 n=1 Tax=Vicia villosa TaxID=3911 RepID=UPI00273AC6D4|nr:uncharacterized protein LOC131604915 [Vicia villosa]